MSGSTKRMWKNFDRKYSKLKQSRGIGTKAGLHDDKKTVYCPSCTAAFESDEKYKAHWRQKHSTRNTKL